MSQWPAAKARRVLAALLRIGWVIKRESGSHRTLARERIRSIRNDFAHSFDHDLSFQDQSITDRCHNLRTAKAFLEGFDIAATRPHSNVSAGVFLSMQAAFKSARRRYQVAVDFIAQHLDDVQGPAAEFTGSDILAEVRSLSAGTTIVILGTGVVGSAGGEDGPAPTGYAA